MRAFICLINTQDRYILRVEDGIRPYRMFVDHNTKELLRQSQKCDELNEELRSIDAELESLCGPSKY